MDGPLLSFQFIGSGSQITLHEVAKGLKSNKSFFGDTYNYDSFIRNNVKFLTLKTKLYIPSTLNIDLIVTVASLENKD